MRVAVLGTGLMGAPMAQRLAAAGHEVAVWSRTRARAELLSDVATVCSSAAEAVREAEFVIAMLLDGPVTRDVFERQGALAACAGGATIIDMGSVDPETDRALARAATDRGIKMLDAPVSGGVVGAETGCLSIFVGGPGDVYEHARGLLEVLGRTTHLGPIGAGQVTKLANQLIVATTIGAVAEGLTLAARAGCDPARVRDALRRGFADSRILELHGKRMVEGDYMPGGRAATQLKDIVNALTLAAEINLDLPLGRTVGAAFRDLVDAHKGADLDHSAYHLWLRLRESRIGPQ